MKQLQCSSSQTELGGRIYNILYNAVKSEHRTLLQFSALKTEHKTLLQSSTLETEQKTSPVQGWPDRKHFFMFRWHLVGEGADKRI